MAERPWGQSPYDPSRNLQRAWLRALAPDQQMGRSPSPPMASDHQPGPSSVDLSSGKQAPQTVWLSLPQPASDPRTGWPLPPDARVSSRMDRTSPSPSTCMTDGLVSQRSVRRFPFGARQLLRIALGIAVLCFVVAIVALVLGVTTAPAPSGVTINPASAAGGTIQAYVVGAVERPGVYTLPAGARIQQLLDAAGGAMPDADMIAVNPAGKINDGDEVYIPRIGEAPPGNIGTAGALVNINTATASQMQTFLHISKTTADHIVAYRQSHGAFTSVAQLLAVPISQSIFDRIKDQVTT